MHLQLFTVIRELSGETNREGKLPCLTGGLSPLSVLISTWTLFTTLYNLLPVTQASLLDKPANETVIIRLPEFARSLLFFLKAFAQCDQLAGLFYRETLIQEGVDKQVHIIFLHLYCPPYHSGYKTSVPRERSIHYYIFYSITQIGNVFPGWKRLFTLLNRLL